MRVCVNTKSNLIKMLRRPLKDITDETTGQVVQDLCKILKFSPQHYFEHSLNEFFEMIFLEGRKKLKTEDLFYPSVLDNKMESLQSSGFYSLCKEIKSGQSLEPYDQMKALTFLKKHYTPEKPARQKKSGLSPQDMDARTIKQRRENNKQ